MMEVQGAIGRVQLKKLREWTAARNSNAEKIWKVCRRHVAVRVPEFRCSAARCADGCAKASGCVHACYKCYVYIQPELLNDGWNRDRILGELNQRGVPCYQGSCPEIYLEKCFEVIRSDSPGRLPMARKLGETSLMFLVHPTLTERDMLKTCEALEDVLGEASRR
jgi:dTDP-4-amino-4,6-dideoxygalactose transaminase